MRAYLRAALESLGDFEVTEASSGVEALGLLARNTFTLLVLDLNMPGITGLELLAFVRKMPAYKAIPAVVVTTEASERELARVMAAGASAYVQKPFTPDTLAAALTVALGAAVSG